MTSDWKLHPANDVLEEYSLGQLSGLACERIEEHLLVCEQCQDELVAVDSFVRDMKYACGQLRTEPGPKRAGFLSRWFDVMPRPALAGAFAALVLAAGAPFLLREGPAGAPVAVDLSAMRGPASSAMPEVERGHALKLRLDARELATAASYRAEVVDGSNKTIWTGTPQQDGTGLTIEVAKPLGRGLHWIRLYGSGADPIREYGLKIK